jgi:hypothetical protein
MWCHVTLRDMILLPHLHDVEYYVDYQTTTSLLLYISLSANTLTGWWQGSKNCQPCRTCWGSETASRQRRGHRSFFWCKLHHHGIILRIVHNYISHCVNTTLQWSLRDDSDNSSVSSDDEYSVAVLPISLLRRPVTKCHQYDDNIAQ